MATILPHSPPPQPPSPSPSILLRRSSNHSLYIYLPITSPSQKGMSIRPFSSLREPLPLVAEDSSSPSENAASLELDSLYSIKETPDFRGCKTCGRREIEKGCNGEGRIQGGIATVPGFGWWPIKAFRPCPEFLASGGRYRRRGQSMDEVAFGKTERDNSAKLNAKSRQQEDWRSQKT